MLGFVDFGFGGGFLTASEGAFLCAVNFERFAAVIAFGSTALFSEPSSFVASSVAPLGEEVDACLDDFARCSSALSPR